MSTRAAHASPSQSHAWKCIAVLPFEREIVAATRQRPLWPNKFVVCVWLVTRLSHLIQFHTTCSRTTTYDASGLLGDYLNTQDAFSVNSVYTQTNILHETHENINGSTKKSIVARTMYTYAYMHRGCGGFCRVTQRLALWAAWTVFGACSQKKAILWSEANSIFDLWINSIFLNWYRYACIISPDQGNQYILQHWMIAAQTPRFADARDTLLSKISFESITNHRYTRTLLIK